ncbi:HTH_Tnp_Tc3_2 domain-containing protein [Trichonephila clavipes]|nr:HTH_Tnp_Tc3_2 domain-containing protein [Trichonephila clavipes]
MERNISRSRTQNFVYLNDRSRSHRAFTLEGSRKLLGAVDTRRYPRAENRVWSDQEDHEERGSKDRAATLVDPTVTRSTIRADVGVAIVPQKNFRYLAEANLKSSALFVHFPLTPEHRQLRLQWCQARSTWNVRLAKGCV